jgi:hypothetical protein
MAIEDAINQLLTGDSTLVAEVGGGSNPRIYPGNLPQTPTFPAIIYYQNNSQENLMTHDAVANIDIDSFRIQIYAKSKLLGIPIRDRIKQLLKGYSGSIDDEVISWVRIVNIIDFPADTDNLIYSIVVEVLIAHKKV